MQKFGFGKAFGVMAIALALAVPAHASFKGFGSDIPLESAARQIVPEGWTVDFGEGVDKNAAVSWSSAPDWQSALRSAVSKKGYSAQFGSKTVVISKSAPSAAPAPVSSKPSRPYSSSPSPKKAQQAKPAPKPAARRPVEVNPGHQGGGGFTIRPYRPDVQAEGAPKDIVTKGDFEPYDGSAKIVRQALFSVHEGQMLHSALASWAEQAGWRLVWESEYDYRVHSAANFGGDFIDAVTKLVDAMSDARPALTVNFYKGNNVLVVSNKSSDEVN